jgi:hypothetical protein
LNKYVPEFSENDEVIKAVLETDKFPNISKKLAELTEVPETAEALVAYEKSTLKLHSVYIIAENFVIEFEFTE